MMKNEVVANSIESHYIFQWCSYCTKFINKLPLQLCRYLWEEDRGGAACSPDMDITVYFMKGQEYDGKAETTSRIESIAFC